MTKRVLVVLTMLAAPIATSVQSSGEQSPAPESSRLAPRLHQIETYLQQEMRAIDIPGLSIAVLDDREIVFSKGYGRANEAGDPVTAHTPFVVGSLSKAVTAAATLQLVGQKKIDLDEPFTTYLTWFEFHEEPRGESITIRHLLNQSSGFTGQ